MQLHLLQDQHGRAYLLFMTVSRWLGVRLDFMSFVLVTVTAFMCMGLRDTLGPGLAGLSLVYVLQTTGQFQWTVRQSAEVENQMTSIERILEYGHLETEDASLLPKVDETSTGEDKMAPVPAIVTDGAATLPEGWPRQPSIRFEHVSMRYWHGMPLVLKNVSLDIRAGERVGIVGRTGAGKSSVLQSLLRLAPMTGRVWIDGVDTSTLPRGLVRRQLACIPQDPVLFSTQLRANLDPFGDHTDAAIFAALDSARLKAVVAALPMGLDTPVAEGGANFSLGQRQLICLARAILHRAKILILDECTANVDSDTDNVIQDNLRSSFVGSTILVVAHRLNTIMDSDKIVVLDAGEIVEVGSPAELLARPAGAFRALYDSSKQHDGRDH